MSHRALTILWPAFLMAGVLEGLVFSALDPDQLDLGVPPLGVYTLAFFTFWAIVATSGALTARLCIDPDAADAARRRN
jgi:hypothetical protein